MEVSLKFLNSCFKFKVFIGDEVKGLPSFILLVCYKLNWTHTFVLNSLLQLFSC